MLGFLSLSANLLAEGDDCSCYITATSWVQGQVGQGYWCFNSSGTPCGETNPCKSSPLWDLCLAKLCVDPCSSGNPVPE